MKLSTIILILILLCTRCIATNRYVSLAGNDANPGTLVSPWQNLSKVSAATYSPGDSILLNRGDVFVGSIVLKSSGTATLPIVISAYGTGAKPVISGLTTLSGWTSIGTNLWETIAVVSTLPYTNVVLVNGVSQQMGRTPNVGTYNYQSFVGKTSITSTNLAGGPNWTGAELAFFMTTYRIGRDRITSQSGNTLTYASLGTDVTPQSNGQAFVIQNDLRTLDVQNEWYYNPVSKKLDIYSVGAPSNVQISTSDSLICLNGRSYIHIRNLDFKAGNITGIWMAAAGNVKILDCKFDMMGRDAIYARNDIGSVNTDIERDTITNSASNGINFYYATSSGTIVRDCLVKNSGLNTFMGANGRTLTGETTHSGIISLGANGLIERNRIDSMAHRGIYISGANSVCQNNYLTYLMITNFHDGGGIYTWGGLDSNHASAQSQLGLVIQNNIVTDVPSDEGIYIDDYSQYPTVRGNTVIRCNIGIYSHNNRNTLFRDNTTYDCATYGFDNYYNNYPLVIEHDKMLKNNIFFARTATQRTAYFRRIERVSSGYATGMDSNYYCRPIADNTTIDSYRYDTSACCKLLTLAQLQAYLSSPPLEVHGKKSPKTITSTTSVRIEFNPTMSPVIVSLDSIYIDVRGISYGTGFITLAPFTSAVLIANGALPIGFPPPSVYDLWIKRVKVKFQ